MQEIRVQSLGWEDPLEKGIYAEYIMRNAGLEEAQAGIKMPGEI